MHVLASFRNGNMNMAFPGTQRVMAVAAKHVEIVVLRVRGSCFASLFRNPSYACEMCWPNEWIHCASLKSVQRHNNGTTAVRAKPLAYAC